VVKIIQIENTFFFRRGKSRGQNHKILNGLITDMNFASNRFHHAAPKAGDREIHSHGSTCQRGGTGGKMVVKGTKCSRKRSPISVNPGGGGTGSLNSWRESPGIDASSDLFNRKNEGGGLKAITF